MKCEKCGQKNIKKAYYCKKCGEPFTEKERKKAEYKGFIGFIKRIEKWYNTCTLKVITDSLIFKMLLIIFLLGIGIYNFTKTGNDLKINEDSSYQVTYNTKEKEYYVYMLENNNINKNGKLHLDLYIPNLVNELDITYYDENNNVLYEVKIPKEEEYYGYQALQDKPLRLDIMDVTEQAGSSVPFWWNSNDSFLYGDTVYNRVDCNELTID